MARDTHPCQSVRSKEVLRKEEGESPSTEPLWDWDPREFPRGGLVAECRAGDPVDRGEVVPGVREDAPRARGSVAGHDGPRAQSLHPSNDGNPPRWPTIADRGMESTNREVTAEQDSFVRQVREHVAGGVATAVRDEVK